MKQLMVLVATIVLGVSISGTVLGFGDSVDSISGNVSTSIQSLGNTIDSKLGISNVPGGN